MLRTRTLASIADAPAAQWNALDLQGRPFLRHEFLLALEHSGSATAATGWEAAHIVAESDGRLAGAVPLYLKPHSWGEFVFDFAWARAYEQHGLSYYPKLVAASPFTPASGPCFLLAAGPEQAQVREALLDAVRRLQQERGASSFHALFVTEEERAWLAGRGLLSRLDCQFHWQNRGYAGFDDFLESFTAVKRKKVRRERRRVAEAGVRFRELHGDDLDETLLDTVYTLHARTFAERGNPPYLTAGFFREIARTMPKTLMVKLALLRGEPVACAIFLRGEDTLYGRYWGATGEHHSLHFEACYHQGIDYCIRKGLARFEPGTQGEHKLARGFTPEPVWSMHELAHPAFHGAVAAYLDRERLHVRAYMDAVRDHVPFRQAAPEVNLGVNVGNHLYPED